MTAHAYLVSAGCSNEGTILNEQPYSGPIDADSLIEFALSTLRNSPYAKSNTAWGLQDMDWSEAENCADEGERFFIVYDYDNSCKDEPGCEDGNCQCEADDYWVSAVPA